MARQLYPYPAGARNPVQPSCLSEDALYAILALLNSSWIEEHARRLYCPELELRSQHLDDAGQPDGIIYLSHPSRARGRPLGNRGALFARDLFCGWLDLDLR